MRPITVSVGPLAAGLVTAIVNALAGVTAGQVYLNGPGATGGTLQSTFVGTGTIVGTTLTLLAVTSGQLVGGTRINGPGLAPGCTVIGPAPGSVGTGAGSTWTIWPAPTGTQTANNIRGNRLYTMDAPRQILITNTEAAGRTFTVIGTDAAGSPIREVLSTNGGNLTTQQNFATVTEVDYAGAAAVGSISVGTAATATSQWVNFDPWAYASVSEQVDVIGAANFTVQISNDDPMSPTNPMAPGQMTWLPDPNAAMVGGSASQFGSWNFVPLWARVLLNSGAGSVSATFVQAGNVNL